jgi:hypothetical protein
MVWLNANTNWSIWWLINHGLTEAWPTHHACHACHACWKKCQAIDWLIANTGRFSKLATVWLQILFNQASSDWEWSLSDCKNVLLTCQVDESCRACRDNVWVRKRLSEWGFLFLFFYYRSTAPRGCLVAHLDWGCPNPHATRLPRGAIDR